MYFKLLANYYYLYLHKNIYSIQTFNHNWNTYSIHYTYIQNQILHLLPRCYWKIENWYHQLHNNRTNNLCIHIYFCAKIIFRNGNSVKFTNLLFPVSGSYSNQLFPFNIFFFYDYYYQILYPVVTMMWISSYCAMFMSI